MLATSRRTAPSQRARPVDQFAFSGAAERRRLAPVVSPPFLISVQA
jgi:hypothetical protein